MFWKKILRMKWQCGKCNIITSGENVGEIEVNDKWKPLCKLCGYESVEIIKQEHPEYEYP